MTTLVALLLMQYVVSVKAGLVNHVQGTANVVEMEMAPEAQPIRTGANGYVEVLLSPGSFLRLGEDSEAVIDNVNLDNVTLTVLRGPAVIEVVEIDEDYPLTVKTGNLTTKVIDTGIYRFADGTASVIQGKLRSQDSQFTWEKGWQVFFQNSYRVRRSPKIQLTSLDVYSQVRSEAIAQANFSLASSLSGPNTYGVHNAWLYTSHIGMYTFIPRWGFQSPYGYRYYGVSRGGPVRNSGYTPSTGGGGGGGGSNVPSSGGGGNNPGDSGGGGGGGSSTPAVSTPSGERSSPAVYIESKNSTVGATSR